MEELMKALREAERNSKALEKSLNETKMTLNTTATSFKSNDSAKSKMSVDLIEAKKKVQKTAPAVSFTKGSRFLGANGGTNPNLSKTQSDLKGSSASMDIRGSSSSSKTLPKDGGPQVMENEDNLSNASTVDMNAYKKKPPQVIFGRTGRWETNPKEDARPMYDTNLDKLKKHSACAIISSPDRTKTKKEIMKENLLAAKQKFEEELDMRSSVETVKLGLEKDEEFLSEILSDTTQVGPGSYDVNFSAVETQRKVPFSRSERFQTPKDVGPADILYPNVETVKKRAPGVKIAAASSSNEKLKTKKRNEETQEEIRAAAELARPLERDRALQPNVATFKMKEKLACLTYEEKLAYFLAMLRDKRDLTKRGPGEYTVRVKRDQRTKVVYRKSHSLKVPPKRIKMPAPNSYYAKDDLIHVHQPKYTIPAAGKNREPKLEDFDRRPALDPNLSAIKPRHQAAIILPEPTVEHQPELHEVKVGPGYYEAKHRLVEPRTDKGKVKYEEITEKNAREAATDLANKEVFDGDLYPNYDFDKPNKGVFKYYEPTIVEPKNVPESKLHPETWKFYDANVDAVREEAVTYDFARNLTRDEFIAHEEQARELDAYLKRKVKHPEAGQYNVRFDAIDPEKHAVDFDRYPERGLDALDKDDVLERAIDGDNLILEPMKPGKHMAEIIFDKIIGRPDHDPREETKEELILDPSDAVTKKRVPMFVNMAKDSERNDMFGGKKPDNHEELLLDVKRDAVEPKVKGVLDFKKITARDDREEKKMPDEEVELHPKYDLTRKHTGGTAVNMERAAKRFIDNPQEDINDGRITTEQKIDLNKAFDSSKPEKNIADFKRYAPRENQDLIQEIQKRREEANKSPPKGPKEIREELENHPNKNKRIYFQKPSKEQEVNEQDLQHLIKPEPLGPWDNENNENKDDRNADEQ